VSGTATLDAGDTAAEARQASVGGGTERLAGRRLYLCTPDRPDLEAFLEAVLRGGVEVVQLRDKGSDDRRLLAAASRAKEVCDDHGALFLVNDRADLAAYVGADGVHLGQDDAPPELARRLLGDRALIGLSTHAPHELDASAASPVDYVSVGPVVPTPTKPGRPGTGVDYVRYASSRSQRPFFVTGGVSPDTVPELVAAGARRFVVVRYLTQAEDPEAAARALATAIDAAVRAAEDAAVAAAKQDAGEGRGTRDGAPEKGGSHAPKPGHHGAGPSRGP
jgi:thiamine-phosphate pyrophosphorylase